jgi:hypothetical protein
LNKAQTLRNKRIAHADQDHVLGITDAEYLNLAELKGLLENLEKFFNNLLFSTEYKLSPRYDADSTAGKARDIDIILDRIAAGAAFIKSPEENSEFWVFTSKDWSADQLATFNGFRTRNGFTSVDKPSLKGKGADV